MNNFVGTFHRNISAVSLKRLSRVDILPVTFNWIKLVSKINAIIVCGPYEFSYGISPQMKGAINSIVK